MSTNVKQLESILVGKNVTLPTRRIHKEFEALLYSNKGKEKQNLPAIFQDESAITFLELDKAANKLARCLIQQIAERGGLCYSTPLVGIMMEPSIDRFIVILAVLKAGAAYVPFDPSYPVERTKNMMKTSNVCITVTDSALTFLDHDEFVLVKEVIERSQTYSDAILDDEEEEGSTDKSTLSLLAMFFTSGTTGEPKAVPVSHKNVLNTVQHTSAGFPLQHDDVIPQFINCLSIVSLVEITSGLLHLIPMVVIPNCAKANPSIFIQIVDKFKITKILAISPTYLKNLVVFLSMGEYKGCCSSLEAIGVGSEIVPPQLLKNTMEVFSYKMQIIQSWGMTETTMTLTETFKSEADISNKTWNGKASLGTPGFNNVIYVVDDDLNPVKTGNIGQIAIAGDSVSSGYISGNTGSFVKNHLQPAPEGHKLFLTGDYGCIVNERVYFEGRRQTRVKVKGYSVNTLEIEDVIKGTPGVCLAAVIGHILKDGEGDDNSLVAYYSQNPHDSTTPKDVRKRCKDLLPAYAVPMIFHLEEMPTSLATGKINYSALHNMFSQYIQGSMEQNDRKYESFDQTSLTAVVAKYLKMKRDDVSLSANFFDLGGDSENATQIWAELKKLGYAGNLSNFMSAKVLRDLLEKSDVESLDSCQEYLTEDMDELAESDLAEAFNICIDFCCFNTNPSFCQLFPNDTLKQQVEQAVHLTRCQEAKKDDASFVLRDTSNKIIVVVLLQNENICCSHYEDTTRNVDLAADVMSTDSDVMIKKWTMFLKHLTDEFLEEQKIAGQNVGCASIFAVAGSLSRKINNKLQTIIQNIKNKALEHDWKFVYADTTIQSTKELLVEYGAKIQKAAHVASFEVDGVYPYSHIGKEVYVWILTFEI